MLEFILKFFILHALVIMIWSLHVFIYIVASGPFYVIKPEVKILLSSNNCILIQRVLLNTKNLSDWVIYRLFKLELLMLLFILILISRVIVFMLGCHVWLKLNLIFGDYTCIFFIIFYLLVFNLLMFLVFIL